MREKENTKKAQKKNALLPLHSVATQSFHLFLYNIFFVLSRDFSLNLTSFEIVKK